jgi:acetyl-CoA carboxylase biotin carboxyl carrier protein
MATIKSPIPGTFYHRPNPDAPAFKKPGDSVEIGEVIGLVEVMKTFHDIKADKTGTVVDYLLDSEDPVDAGQDVLELK